MDLKDIAAVSGKSGLFKVLKPTRTGVILESIDQQKNKLVANANDRVSLLKEISVYTTSKEASIPLEDVFESINKKYGKTLAINAKSSEAELRKFIEEVVPDYDSERVYNSDIKKIVSWYSILAEFQPEVFEVKEEPKAKKAEATKEETQPKEKKASKKEASTEENKEAKPKAKKTSTPKK